MLDDAPITKRQLGWLMLAAGALAAVAVVGVDVFGAGRFSGLGPAQGWALSGCGLSIAFGLLLLPLGDRPA
jgi:hypothetical protein